MNSNLFSQRRERLSQLCDEGSMLLLFAKSDSGLSFVQNNNFFYLTGLNIPNAVLMILKNKGKLVADIFIERSIPERIVWDGEKMSKDEVKKISGIERVHYLDMFEPQLTTALAAKNIIGIKKIFIENGNLSPQDGLDRPLTLTAKLRDRYPHLEVGCLSQIINPMRMIKDEWELEQLQTAINITAKGLKRVMHSPLAGLYEYQVEAMLFYELQNEKVRSWAFKPIVAGGNNATTLHYSENCCKIAANDLLLMDVGALYNNYSADITRTIPVAKKFTKRQKEVYSEVLNVQKEIVNLVEPGLTLMKLNENTVELITEALFRLKLIKKKNEYRKYYMHSVSHFLGMEAHDVFKPGAILEPGNVITVEPGIYIPEEGIGVRIEDDILITDKGSELLTTAVPKEVDELEDIRANIGK